MEFLWNLCEMIVSNACPECGAPEYLNKDELGSGFRVCFHCSQEWWTDIKYDHPTALPLSQFMILGRERFLQQEGTRFTYEGRIWRIDSSSVLVPMHLFIAHGLRVLKDGSLGKTRIHIQIENTETETLITPSISRPRLSGRGISKQ